MNHQLMSLSAASDLIRSGAFLSLAAPEPVLRTLPAGNWIGGTIPYFMADEGGVVANEGRVFVTALPADGTVTIAHYGPDAVGKVVGNGPDNGFTVAIVPAFSEAHRRFAEGAASDADAFLKPTVGWVSGVHLSDIGKATPKVVDGRSGAVHADGVLVAHVALPEGQLASIEIVNIFEPDGGDVLHFDETSFNVGHCRVNGERVKLSDYLAARGATDGKLPLVGDFGGAHLNASIQAVDADAGTVALYAPVFSGVDYRLAKPVANYAASFREKLAGHGVDGVAFSCNCILNFVYGDLEGHHISDLNGPVTFGEIGYQLLNQTLVVLRIQ